MNGQFKDYCDPVDFQYNRSKAGAANCPVGWERISNASECRTAVAFFAFADNTGSAAQYGSESFPGCVRFTTNNSVVFNGDPGRISKERLCTHLQFLAASVDRWRGDKVFGGAGV